MFFYNFFSFLYRFLYNPVNISLFRLYFMNHILDTTPSFAFSAFFIPFPLYLPAIYAVFHTIAFPLEIDIHVFAKLQTSLDSFFHLSLSCTIFLCPCKNPPNPSAFLIEIPISTASKY